MEKPENDVGKNNNVDIEMADVSYCCDNSVCSVSERQSENEEVQEINLPVKTSVAFQSHLFRLRNPAM